MKMGSSGVQDASSSLKVKKENALLVTLNYAMVLNQAN